MNDTPKVHPYDNSQISTFQTCQMQYYLQYLCGLKRGDKADDSTMHIDFGKHFHDFLERYYKHEQNISIKEIWSEYHDREGEYAKTQKSGEFLCKQYHLKWSHEDHDLKILDVEQSLQFEVNGVPFLVKVDMVYEKNGSIYGREHKTGKNIGYNYFDKYHFINSQISAQYYAIKQKYGRCDGIEVNAAEIKSLSRKPTSSDYDGWEPFTKDDGRNAWRTAKFRRDICTRMPNEINDWYENVSKWISQLERTKETQEFLKSDGLWSGIICSNCEYRDLCKVSVGMNINESVRGLFYLEVEPYEYMYQ